MIKRVIAIGAFASGCFFASLAGHIAATGHLWVSLAVNMIGGGLIGTALFMEWSRGISKGRRDMLDEVFASVRRAQQARDDMERAYCEAQIAKDHQERVAA